MRQENVGVCIIYPADPVGVIPGGIDTFIRGILKWAPDDITISLVGVTTNRKERPVGVWVECDLGRRKFQFFAAAALDNPEGRGLVPLSVRFTLGLLFRTPEILADVLEFHRIEPSLLYMKDARPKNAFVHQNMKVLNEAGSDIIWSKLPKVYFWLERKLMTTYASLYAVREDAVETYKESYPEIADRFHFIPTWYDPEVFFSINDGARSELRKIMGFGNQEIILVTVGRLDTQKDPLLLLAAFQRVVKKIPEAKLIYIGDGVLRGKVEKEIEQASLGDRVELQGLRSAEYISRILQAADLFVLSSAYEGMPMCILEALGSGLPVVTTDVGEVGKVVKSGINGHVTEDRSSQSIAAAILDALDKRDTISGLPCTDAVENYTPERVLEPVYKNYRNLAGKDHSF